VIFSPRWLTDAPAHHGRNSGYSSTLSTRENICCAAYPTSADLSTWAMALQKLIKSMNFSSVRVS